MTLLHGQWPMLYNKNVYCCKGKGSLRYENRIRHVCHTTWISSERLRLCKDIACPWGENNRSTLYLNILFAPACTNAGYHYAGGICTLYSDSELTWNDARADCKAKGGDLVRFCDASEMQVIKETYKCR